MAYATADEYRARIQSGRTDDAVILEVLNAAQDQIHQRTGRRFDSTTTTRTVRVINAAAYLPDLITATAVQWASSRFGTFADVEYVLDDRAPHRVAIVKQSSGFVEIEGDWGFDPTPEAIKQCEIDLAAGLLVDGPRATRLLAQTRDDAPIATLITPNDIIEAYKDRVQYT